MKALKIIGIIVGVLVILILIVPLFLPSVTVVERSIVIDRPLELIFDDLTNYNVYSEWNPWSKMEPTAEQTITGEPGKPGHTWSWKGQKIGSGSLTLVEAKPYESIEGKLVFTDPMQSESKDLWKFERDGTNTKVIWINESEADYPFGRLFGAMMMDKMIGKDFEAGLQNLKEYIENKY